MVDPDLRQLKIHELGKWIHEIFWLSRGWSRPCTNQNSRL